MDQSRFLETILECYHAAKKDYVPLERLRHLPGVQWAARYRNFLYYLVQKLRPQLSLELGTDNGTTAAFMGAAAEPGQEIHTLDLIRRADTMAQLDTYSAVTYHAPLSSLKAAPLFTGQKIGILYMDTDHTYKTTTREKNIYLPMMDPWGIMLVDDIMLQQDMIRFWKEIREPKFVLRDLHYQHIGLTSQDHTLLPEGTGFGMILPHCRFSVLGLDRFPEHPTLGGRIIT